MDSAETHSLNNDGGSSKSKNTLSSGLDLSNALVMEHSKEIRDLRREMEMLKIRHRVELDASTKLQLQYKKEKTDLQVENSSLKRSIAKQVKAAKIRTIRMMKAKYDRMMLFPEKDWAVTSLETYEEKVALLEKRLNEAESKLKSKIKKVKILEVWVEKSNDERLKWEMLYKKLKNGTEDSSQESCTKGSTDMNEMSVMLKGDNPQLETPMEEVKCNKSVAVAEAEKQRSELEAKKNELREKILMNNFDVEGWSHRFRRTSIEGTSEFKVKLSNLCCRTDCARKKLCSAQKNAIEKRQEVFEKERPPAEERAKFCYNCYKKKVLEEISVDELVYYIFNYQVK